MIHAADILDPAFEKRIEDVVAEKKKEIETVLVETIDGQKVRAKQQIAELEKEFEKEKENLHQHKARLEAVKTASDEIQGSLRKHIEQARRLRLQIPMIAAQIGEECRKAGELTQKIRELCRNADEETALLQARLADRYGMTAQIADLFERSCINSDLEEELQRLNEFRKRLPVEVEESCGAGENAREAGTKCGDNIQVQESSDPSGTAVPPPAAPQEPASESDMGGISGILEAYRRTESVPDGGEFSYYQKAEAIIIDGESLLGLGIRLIESAKNRHARLAETKSAKERFTLKREIIDQQDLLRKAIQRAVKLCEKEKGLLPNLTSDIIDLRILKGVLDRLNMGNWSDPYEIKAFEDEISALKASLSSKTSDRLAYQKSILDQLN